MTVQEEGEEEEEGRDEMTEEEIVLIGREASEGEDNEKLMIFDQDPDRGTEETLLIKVEALN